MSDFVNTLHKFCSSHQQPPEGLAFGGRWQLYLYSAVTNKLHTRARGWSDYRVPVAFEDEPDKVTKGMENLATLVANFCTFTSYFYEYSGFATVQGPAEFSNQLEDLLSSKGVDLGPLEYALAYISHLSGGSQKTEPELDFSWHPEDLTNATQNLLRFGLTNKPTRSRTAAALFNDYLRKAVKSGLLSDYGYNKTMSDFILGLTEELNDSMEETSAAFDHWASQNEDDNDD